MIESDTIKLLRECDAGVKMGITSIDDCVGYVRDTEMKDILRNCRVEHQDIMQDMQELLNKYHDSGKEPPAMAKGMSWLKTNFKLAVNESDNQVAELITDGCNMGVKSLSGYLNKYKAADEKSKKITKKLIGVEEKLCTDMKKFL